MHLRAPVSIWNKETVNMSSLQNPAPLKPGTDGDDIQVFVSC